MRIAILADIHSNREAFEAVLQRLPAARIDRIVLLGDLVGYGPDPEFAVDTAARLIEAGALAVLGNHDAAIGDPDADLNASAQRAIDWTRARLDAAQRRFLAVLPETQSLGGALFVHASAHVPRAWEYVTGPLEARRALRASKTRLTIVGHVHRPHLWHLADNGPVIAHAPVTGVDIPMAQNHAWLAVMGAVGQPRDGNPAAAFGVLDTDARTLSFERVAYDHALTSRKVREAGLPEALASRLLIGR